MSLQVNLHNHSEGSFLDGYARVPQIIDRAKALGHQFVALTDHGECNQHLTLAKAAEKQGIGAIYGMEGYWLPAEKLAAAKEQGKYPSPSHICLLAATDEGLRNLWALSSEAYQDPYYYYKPIADLDLLRKYSAGVYGSDGCMMTEFAEAVIDGREDQARLILGSLLDIYGDRFYCELHTWQYCELPVMPSEDDPSYDRVADMYRLNANMTAINQAKVALATEMGIQMVVVNDSHHAEPADWYNKELVWAFNTGQDSDKLRSTLESVAQKADHLMGEDELVHWMGKHGIHVNVVSEAIKNSFAIAQSCHATIRPRLAMPRVGASERDDLVALIDACEAGFKQHVIDAGLDQERYYRRMEEELALIADKKFAGYFNMVRDYTGAYRSGAWSQYVRPGAPKDPVLIGPGRGSVGGSLVAYLLGIDIIDPIKYGTLFSRFLTPDRKGMPDIDVDVPQSQRPEMLHYITKRFGAGNVCAIGTLSRNGPKQTVKDLGRALGINKQPGGYSDLEAISEHIAAVERLKDPDNPDEADLTWSELIARKGGELKPWALKYPQLFSKMEEMTGLIRHSGVHAAGILVSSTPLLGAVPMRRTKNKVITTQLDMGECEELGGVKLDLLGIRHLDTLTVARKLIYERHGVWIDYDCSGLSVPAGCTNVLKFGAEQFSDPTIWDQIDRGHTTGIFQIETSTGTEAAIALKPRNEFDTANLISITRPGVADAGLKDVYLRRRAGAEPVAYDHPLMENFVGPKWSTDTYGVLVYQEQLVLAVEQLAGFTPDESDTLRKVVGKKQMEKLLTLKEKFFTGCLANPAFMEPYIIRGKPDTVRAQATAAKIWDSIEASGRYAFNFSHAVGYAIISTWEIWTKHHYFREFLIALMQTDSDHINKYLREARRRGIPILPPDINESQRKFIISGEGIRYGLDTVRGVGAAVCRSIERARPFTDFNDYLARAGEAASLGAVTNLIHIGALDSLGTREDLLRQLERHRVLEKVSPNKLAKLTEDQKDEIWAEKVAKYPGQYAVEIPDFSDPEVVYEIEQRLVGTHVTVDPMGRYLHALDSVAIREPTDMSTIPVGNEFIIGGQIAGIRPTVTKKGRNPGQDMAHMVVRWNEADFRIVVFPDAWANTKRLLAVGAPVACKVKRLESGCCLQSVERLDLLWKESGLE